MASAVIALVVGALTFKGGAVYIGGWLLSGPIGILLIARFGVFDAARQARVFYVMPTWLPWAYRVAFLLSFGGILINAWRIASWVGHM